MNKLETELKKIIWRKSPRGPDSHLCILYVFTVWKVLSGHWFSVYCADIMANVCFLRADLPVFSGQFNKQWNAECLASEVAPSVLKAWILVSGKEAAVVFHEKVGSCLTGGEDDLEFSGYYLQ